MTPVQWAQAKAVFDEVCELPEGKQRDAVARLCSGDPVVRAEVEKLLDLDGKDSRFLSPPSAPRFLKVRETDLLAADSLVAGRYRIRRLVGAGGMGEVYEAVDSETAERIALKTVRAAAGAGPRAHRQIEREARLAGAVSHRNICRILSVERHHLPSGGDVAVLAMEYLEGLTLAQWIRTHAPAPAAVALPLVRQMCAALDAAHRAGVIHRDFKPSNMILDGDRLVVTDFGLAVFESAESSSSGVTSTGSRFLGTPEYMAPEQLRSGESTARSDIFSLGVVLFEMVTGERPSQGSNSLEEILGRFLVPPKSPRLLNPGLEASWELAILNCLSTDPARRPPSAGEVLRQMEANPAIASLQLLVRRPLARRTLLAGGVAAAGGAAWKAYRWRWPAKAAATSLLLAGDAASPEEAAIRMQIRMLIGQSRSIRLWDGTRRNAVLALMGRRASDRLTSRDWHEIAARENFAMAAFVTLNGGALQLRLEQVGARPDMPAAAWTKEIPASDSNRYLESAAAAAAWLRDTMGESAGAIAETSMPPEAVTTPSWAALREFQQAEEYRARGLRPEAIVALDAAIRYDPEFTMAYARRGDVLISLGRNAEAFHTYREAERLLKVRPMSRREELRFLAMFAQDSSDYRRAEKLFLEYAQLFPEDHYGFFHRASALQFLGMFHEALGSLAKLELMPESTRRRLVHSCYAAAGAGEFDRAHGFAAQLLDQGHHDYGYAGLECIAYVRGRSAEALEHNRAGVRGAAPARAARQATGQAMILADAGRTADAHAVLLRSAEQNRSNGLRSNLAHDLLSLAALELRLGTPSPVTGRLDESLALDAGPENQAIAVELLAASGAIGRAKAIRASFEPQPLQIFKVAFARMEAAIAAAEGRRPEALAHARDAAREDQLAGGKPYLARALLASGLRQQALYEFVAVHRQKVHQSRRIFPEPAGYWREAMENAFRIAESDGDALRTQVREYLELSAI